MTINKMYKTAQEIKQNAVQCLREEMNQRGFSNDEIEMYCETLREMLEFPIKWEWVYLYSAVIFAKKLLESSEEERPMKNCAYNALMTQIGIYLPETENNKEKKYLNAISYGTKAIEIYEDQIAGTGMEDPALISEICFSGRPVNNTALNNEKGDWGRYLIARKHFE